MSFYISVSIFISICFFVFELRRHPLSRVGKIHILRYEALKFLYFFLKNTFLSPNHLFKTLKLKCNNLAHFETILVKIAFLLMILWIFNEKWLKYCRVIKNKETHAKCTGFKILMRYDVTCIIFKLYQIKLIKSYDCFDKKYFKEFCLK